MWRGLLILILGVLVAWQPPKFKLIASIPTEATYFTTDHLGYSYLVSPTNALDKYAPDGKWTTTQNIKVLGPLTSIDPSNPLEVYGYYRDVNQIAFFDNMLALRGQLNLNEGPILQASAAARSFDNGLWVFDLTDLQLKRLGKDQQVIQESGNVRFFTEATLAPNFILDYNNKVYLNNPESGILVFDIFATYLKTIPLQGLRNFQVLGDNLYYFNAPHFVSYNLTTFQRDTLALPDTTALRDVRVEKGRLFLLKEKSLNLYAFEP